MKKATVFTIIAVALLGTTGYFLLRNGGSGDSKYRAEKATRGSVVLQVRATGTINPVRTVEVGSQVSGTLEKIYVDFNSVVTRGQVVAQIDSTFLYASVKEAEANLERNLAQVNEAKRSFTRTTELFNKALVSQADLDAAQTAYEAAAAQLKQTQAALDRAMVNLRFSIIRAPISGVVISRDVDVGQTVAASLQAPKLFVIAKDLKEMQVEASVDEADIGQIREGEEATFTVDAYPDEQFSGRVTQVRLSPVITQNVVTYTVIIEVSNPEMKLRPGMTATVSVLIEKREDALRVPTLALRFQPPQDVIDKWTVTKPGQTPPSDTSGGQAQRKPREWRREGAGAQSGMAGEQGRKVMKKNTARIWILENGKDPKPVMVSTGLNDNRYVEITGGDLKEGDEVILQITGPESAAGAGQQTNPFQQRMPGGGGGRGRGF